MIFLPDNCLDVGHTVVGGLISRVPVLLHWRMIADMGPVFSSLVCELNLA